MLRHDVLHVQANVSGIGANHTDVVAASETVKLRPDLAVSHLAIPAVVRVNVPATISATVREANGDVGARANCVLRVDGVEADRAPGIWVDAQSSVTCSFSTIFTSAGVHQVSVAAIDVAPGDWDDANNAVAAQVEVVAAAAFTRHRVEAQDITSVSTSSSTAPWGENTEERTLRTQRVIFFGYTDQAMNLDTMTATVQTSSDGVALDDSSSIPLTRGASYEPDGTWGWGCFYGWEPATQRGITGCGSWSTYGGTLQGSVDLTYTRESNGVTYHSFGWDSRFYNQDGSYWTWNQSSTTTAGQFQEWGNTVTLHVTLTDGAKTFAATPTVAFTPHSFEWGFGSCYQDWYTGGTACSQFLRTESGRIGNVSEGY